MADAARGDRPSAPDRPARPPIEVVIDGTDGAGKTACVAALIERWTRAGLRVVGRAPYREREVYPLWATEPARAAQIITAIIARARADTAGADLLVWDRGWPTAFVSTDDAAARAGFAPLPPLTVLLLGSAAATRRKAMTQHPRGVWVSDDALIARYHAAYHALAAPAGTHLLRALPDAADRFDVDAIARWLDERLEPLRARC